MSNYTVKDVTKDLTTLMSLTTIFGVDDQGFWTDTLNDDKRFEYRLGDDDTAKQIVVFQDPFPKGDYYYFNPFSEGLGTKSPADQLFYRTIRVAANSNIRLAMLHVIDQLLECKTNDALELDPIVLRMAAVPIDKKTSLADVVDDKLHGEFNKMFDRCGVELVQIPYYQNQMTAKLISAVLTDPQWTEKYGADIRKKSVLAFKTTLMGVIGITTEKGLAEFDTKYDPKTKSAARLDTTLNVYLKLYDKFNSVLNENYAIDLGGLAEVIERLPLAYAIAKHMVQPTLPKLAPTDTRTVDTSRGITVPHASGGRKFDVQEVVGRDQFGGLNVRTQTHDSQAGAYGRFSPQVLSATQQDPLSPMGNAYGGARANSGPFGGMTMSGHGESNSMFGGGSPYGGVRGGINMSVPSNFGRPEVRKNYFGR